MSVPVYFSHKTSPHIYVIDLSNASVLIPLRDKLPLFIIERPLRLVGFQTHSDASGQVVHLDELGRAASFAEAVDVVAGDPLGPVESRVIELAATPSRVFFDDELVKR